jgi:hypothetical protein
MLHFSYVVVKWGPAPRLAAYEKREGLGSFPLFSAFCLGRNPPINQKINQSESEGCCKPGILGWSII